MLDFISISEFNALAIFLILLHFERAGTIELDSWNALSEIENLSFT